MPDPAGSPGLVLDANVCINLLATEAVAEVLAALNVPCHLPEQVLAEVTRDPVTRIALPDAGHPLRGHAPNLPAAHAFWTADLLRAPAVVAALGPARATDLFDRAKRHGRMHVPRP